MTDDEFDLGLSVLINGVGRAMPKDQVDVWRSLLSDLTFDEFKRGIAACLRNYKFAGFPPVGLIRESAGAAVGLLDGDAGAVLAWDRVRASISKIGAYQSVDWRDAAIPHAIESAAGSWAELCDTSPEELSNFTRKRFLDAYKAHRAAGTKSDGISRGLIASDAGKLGFEQPEPARLGEPTRATIGFGGHQLPALPGPVEPLTRLIGRKIPDEEQEPRDVIVGADETPEQFESRKAEMMKRLAMKYPQAEGVA